jgi:hypothetical protein
VTHEFKARMADEMLDIALGAGEKVIEANDVMAVCQQTITQMRP